VAEPEVQVDPDDVGRGDEGDGQDEHAPEARGIGDGGGEVGPTIARHGNRVGEAAHVRDAPCVPARGAPSLTRARPTRHHSGSMTPLPNRVRAAAPGCVGNVGPGLDVLGLAVGGAFDAVVAERRAEPGVVVLAPGHPDLPADPARHASAIAARAVLERAAAAGITAACGAGIALRVEKGLPLAGGQGGSAASAVAGAAATNALLGGPLDAPALMAACLEAEAAVAGRHLDNIAPSLLGGLVLVRALDPIDVVALAVPDDLVVVLAHPAQRLRTAEGRAVLPPALDRGLALYQAAQVAALVAAFATADWALLGRALDDRIAEPARAPLLPGFREAKAAALAAGAHGCSISGSGPTSFALARGADHAARVADAMAAAYERAGVACTVRSAAPDRTGVRVAHLA
jgi:homoserine kinase